MNIQNAIEQYIQEYFNEELDTSVTECLGMVDFSDYVDESMERYVGDFAGSGEVATLRDEIERVEVESTALIAELIERINELENRKGPIRRLLSRIFSR